MITFFSLCLHITTTNLPAFMVWEERWYILLWILWLKHWWMGDINFKNILYVSSCSIYILIFWVKRRESPEILETSMLLHYTYFHRAWFKVFHSEIIFLCLNCLLFSFCSFGQIRKIPIRKRLLINNILMLYQAINQSQM